MVSSFAQDLLEQVGDLGALQQLGVVDDHRKSPGRGVEGGHHLSDVGPGGGRDQQDAGRADQVAKGRGSRSEDDHLRAGSEQRPGRCE